MAIELSNETRCYALLTLLVVINTTLFIRWVDQGRRMDYVLYVITMFLAWYTHYYALALPAAHGVTLMVIPEGRRRLGWFGAMAIASLLWSWLPSFVHQLQIPGNGRRMGDRWVYQFLVTPMVFSVGRTFAWRDSSRAMLGLATVGSLIGFWWPAIRDSWSGTDLLPGSCWLGVDPDSGTSGGRPDAYTDLRDGVCHRRASRIPAYCSLGTGALPAVHPAVAIAIILSMTAFSLSATAPFRSGTIGGPPPS